MIKYDAIVIGSGQGGNPLAHRLADLGKRVALIEEEYLGGTCINTGCTPTKTMVASAQVAHYARHAAQWGVRASNVSVDLPAVLARKNKVVGAMRAAQEKHVEKRKTLTLYREHARFSGSHQLSVGAHELESEWIFIDTGGRPTIPHIPGLDSIEYLTNVSMLELPSVPDRLIVIGGGYIGLEFGQMFRRFGSEVTIIQRGSQIVPREDEEIAIALRKALEAEGIRFLLNAKVATAEKHKSGVLLAVEQDGNTQTLSGSHLLLAAGRTPNTDKLEIEKSGVALDKRGYVRVNHRLETNVPGIWALGDVNGGPAFTHISYSDFQILYANLIEGKNLSTAERIVPYAVFTDPQLGCVGLSEKEARAKGYELKIGRMPMANVARAIERDETAGLMKLIVNAKNDQILGASILGTEGGELVQTLHAMMLAKQPYTLLRGAIYIHPTLTEGFFGLMESVS